MRDRNVRESGRRAGWPLAVAALGALLWVGATSAPARADSNFERGFEDQMGRILAFEAVNLGKHILFQGVVHPAVHGGGYGHAPAYGYGHGYVPQPTVFPNVVPVYTHEHGKRPYRWNGYGYQHPGKRLGHSKHDDWRRHRGRHDRHDRHDRHHRHDRGCRH